MIAQVKFRCQCQEEYQLVFRKPSMLKPTILTTTCSSCGSEYLIRYKRHTDKSAPRNHLVLTVLKATLTQELQDLLVEEKAFQEAQK